MIARDSARSNLENIEPTRGKKQTDLYQSKVTTASLVFTGQATKQTTGIKWPIQKLSNSHNKPLNIKLNRKHILKLLNG